MLEHLNLVYYFFQHSFVGFPYTMKCDIMRYLVLSVANSVLRTFHVIFSICMTWFTYCTSQILRTANFDSIGNNKNPLYNTARFLTLSMSQ